MEYTKRRIQLLKLLCKSKNEKTSHLASEFGVSDRTIRRDIQLLDLLYPIYTKQGKNGGIRIKEGTFAEGSCFQDKVLLIMKSKQKRGTCLLSSDEIECLIYIVSEFTPIDRE